MTPNLTSKIFYLSKLPSLYFGATAVYDLEQNKKQGHNIYDLSNSKTRSMWLTLISSFFDVRAMRSPLRNIALSKFKNSRFNKIVDFENFSNLKAAQNRDVYFKDNIISQKIGLVSLANEIGNTIQNWGKMDASQKSHSIGNNLFFSAISILGYKRGKSTTYTPSEVNPKSIFSEHMKGPASSLRTNAEEIKFKADQNEPFTTKIFEIPEIRALIKKYSKTNNSYYPHKEYVELYNTLSIISGLPQDYIHVTGSGTRALRLVGSLMRNGEGINTQISYFDLVNGIQTSKGRLITAPMHPNYGISLKGIATKITPKTEFIFLTNPNNPTGTHMDTNEIVRFANYLNNIGRSDIILAIDATYARYRPKEEFKILLDAIKSDKYKNLLVFESSSKTSGMVNLRFAKIFGHPKLISQLKVADGSFPVTGISAQIANIIEEHPKIDSWIKKLIKFRTSVETGLQNLNIPIIPSQGNFVTLDCGNKQTVQRLYLHLLDNYQMVTRLQLDHISHLLRFTILKKAGNEAFLKGVKEFFETTPHPNPGKISTYANGIEDIHIPDPPYWHLFE